LLVELCHENSILIHHVQRIQLTYKLLSVYSSSVVDIQDIWY
jgi:hypothetical protein